MKNKIIIYIFLCVNAIFAEQSIFSNNTLLFCINKDESILNLDIDNNLSRSENYLLLNQMVLTYFFSRLKELDYINYIHI